MIIYSVSVSIEKSVAEDWKEWMLAHHIPEVMDTGCFESYTMCKMLEPLVDKQAITYNIQYRCLSEEVLSRYQKEYAPDLQASHNLRYNNRFHAFRSILAVVS